MTRILFLTLLGLFLSLPFAKGQESTSDSQTVPQALALYIAGNVSGCEALISNSVPSGDWTSATGLLMRAKNLIYLGAYAKEQDNITVAQAIGATVTQLLDSAVLVLPAGNTSVAALQLNLRASLEETLLGNSEQAELLRQQALALEPPPAGEPLSPPEE